MATTAGPQDFANLLKLLSAMYPTQALNVSQDVIRPNPIPNKPWGESPWGTPAASIPTPPAGGTTPQGTPASSAGGGGRGQGASSEPEGWGKMSPGQRAGIGLAGIGSSLVGLGPLGYGLGLMGLASDKIAGPYESNPYAGLRASTPQGIRDIADYNMIEAQQAQRDLDQRNADIESNRQSISNPTAGFKGISESRTGETNEPDTTSPGFAGYGRGDPGYGNAPGMGDSGQGGPGGSTDSSGKGGDTSSSESGNAWARGGVSKTKKQTSATYGEPGTAPGGRSGETAIFIPEVMKRMGLQGREQEVIRSLKSMLQILEGGKKTSSAKEPANGGRR